MNKKKILWRVGALVVLLAIAAVMFVIGRGHTIYVDNKKLEYNGETIECPYRILVNDENGEKIGKLSAKDRGMATCIGQTFKMSLEVTQNKGDDPVAYDFVIDVPYNMDGVIINLPGLLSGVPAEAYTSEFIPAEVTPTEEDETVVTDEFAMDSDF